MSTLSSQNLVEELLDAFPSIRDEYLAKASAYEMGDGSIATQFVIYDFLTSRFLFPTLKGNLTADGRTGFAFVERMLDSIDDDVLDAAALAIGEVIRGAGGETLETAYAATFLSERLKDLIRHGCA